MEVFYPNIKNELEKTTHLAIAAHQDDIEIMAYDGIKKCYLSENNNFTGVVVTNGSGSPRAGKYAQMTDEDMIAIRKEEQKKAAIIGGYNAQIFLDFMSSEVKDSSNRSVIEDIKKVILDTKPQVIYTHNLADKHDSHLGVAVKTIIALRELDYIPKGFYGCEVWRGLDWLNDSDKTVFDVSGNKKLELDILSVFDSQIAGGKRYDLATMGRRLQNATFFESHGVDISDSISYALDLMPLILDKKLDIIKFITNYIDSFKNSQEEKLWKVIKTKS